VHQVQQKVIKLICTSVVKYTEFPNQLLHIYTSYLPALCYQEATDLIILKNGNVTRLTFYGDHSTIITHSKMPAS